MRTVVTFQSVFFNTSVEKDYFINQKSFGDDVCKWLIHKLGESGVQADSEPLQNDAGWYFNFTVPEGKYRCFLAYRPGGRDVKEGLWIGRIEKRRGVLGFLLGGRDRRVAASAVTAIHRALAEAREIGSVRWHIRKDFDQGREYLASLQPWTDEVK
ncbi:MAG TPA: hypothetical protein VGK99_18600 [Acidobacteriota bacterium]|jgi:hypothetical protein